MMADFFTNLRLRSTGDRSAIAILQPRLPSLFEPLHGADQLPTPPPDPVVREVFTPTAESSATDILQTELPISPSTIMVEPRLPPKLNENNQSVASQEEVLPSTQEIGQITSPQIQVVKPVSLFEEPQQTVLPGDAHESSVNREHLTQENHSFPLNKDDKPPRAKSLFLRVQMAEEIPLPTKMIKNSLETRMRPLKEDPFVEETVRPNKEAFPVKIRLKPAAVPQPILTASHPAGLQQFEKPQEEQRIVEIHIGRIEVRATPAPVNQHSKPRPATIMTLDEYLQRRNAGDR